MTHVIGSSSVVHNPHQLNIEAVAELAKRCQWVCWRYETSKGKTVKAPYQPNGRYAKSSKIATWSSHQECYEAAYVKGEFTGIGFVFTKEDEYVGIDLDDCVDADGNISDFAKEVIELVDSYTEMSPSGTGLHIICKGRLPDVCKTKRIEMYTWGRYFCVTGQSIDETPRSIRFAGEALRELYEKHKTGEARENGRVDLDMPSSVGELLLKFPAQKHKMLFEADKEFRTSWDGKRSGDPSADIMSCMVIATKCGWSPEEIAGLYAHFYVSRGRTDKLDRRGWEGFITDQVERAKHYASSGRPIELAELDDHADEEGPLAAVSEALGVQITEMVQVGSARSQWYLVAQGVKFCVGTTLALISLDQTKARIFEATGHMIPPMKKARWEALVGLMRREARIEEADESVEFGAMRAVLQDYLQFNTPEKADFYTVSNSRPIRKDGEILINQTHFNRYLYASGARVNGLTPAGFLKALGCSARSVTAWDDDREKSAHRRYWSTIEGQN